MAFIRLRNASNQVVFDSTLAVGGVVIGFYTVATGGSTWSFPDFPGAGGFAISAGRSGGYLDYTVDGALGYPRFAFTNLSAGQTVVLFAK